MRLQGKVAVVTGGAQGIGRAIALGLGREGAKIVVADLQAGKAKNVVDELQALGTEGYPAEVNVANESSVKRLANATFDRFGKVDILVNDAGVYLKSLVVEMSEELWDRTINVNLGGNFLCSRAFISSMRKQKSGRIMNTASNYGVTGSALRTPYAAAKAGIITFTKSLALELAADLVLANTVAPGPTDTPRVMEKESAEARKQRWWPQIPLGRTALPQDIAEMYYFLTTPESAAITGQTFHVNGGVVMP